MILFKRCPKCSGDLQIDRDCYGYYVSCFQCGYYKEIPRPQARAKARSKPRNLKER
jgi:hypothetical protein